MKTNARLAIIGAGPGGLLCARILQQRGLKVTVYDADASATARDQGGSLDLHADTGQIALEDAGLMDAFMALARVEDQAKKRLDHHGTVLDTFVPSAGDVAAPEIDRGQLRVMLAEHLQPGTVRWNHKLLAATPRGDGVHVLEFANGEVAEVDLVIGADGAWSRVRPLVSSAQPAYSGVSYLDVQFEDVDQRHPQLAQLIGDGHVFVADGEGRGIIGQRNSGNQIRGYVCMRTELDWAERAGLDASDTAAVRAYLLETFSGWAPELLPFITGTDFGYINRPGRDAARPADLGTHARRDPAGRRGSRHVAVWRFRRESRPARRR